MIVADKEEMHYKKFHSNLLIITLFNFFNYSILFDCFLIIF